MVLFSCLMILEGISWPSGYNIIFSWKHVSFFLVSLSQSLLFPTLSSCTLLSDPCGSHWVPLELGIEFLLQGSKNQASTIRWSRLDMCLQGTMETWRASGLLPFNHCICKMKLAMWQTPHQSHPFWCSSHLVCCEDKAMLGSKMS